MNLNTDLSGRPPDEIDIALQELYYLHDEPLGISSPLQRRSLPASLPPFMMDGNNGVSPVYLLHD